jgi:NAD(P)H-dependent FMN reductase
MHRETLSLAIIIGSNRQGRLGEEIGAWAQRIALSNGGFKIDVIDVAQLALPHDYPDKPNAPLVKLRNRIDAADAFVVVTPEYNHSFPAPLKHLIDQAYDEWRAKAVAFVSYGGVSGGLRAVEALRLVFAELQAVTIRDGVCFPFAWNTFGVEAAVDFARYEKAAGMMFAQLAWWSTALKHARLALPEPKVRQ